MERTWRTSDKALAEELVNVGHELVDSGMDGLTPFYEFPWSMDLADDVVMSRVELGGREEQFTTSDISLVAFMKLRGAQPLFENIREEQRGQKTVRSMCWVFEDSEKNARVVAEFYGCPEKVDVRLYNEHVAALRSHAIGAARAERF